MKKFCNCFIENKVMLLIFSSEDLLLKTKYLWLKITEAYLKLDKII